jgi:uncharacterized protein
MTLEKLKTQNAKDLAAMAKRSGVAGWHSMRKEELIRALVRRERVRAAAAAKDPPSNGNGHSNGQKNGNGKIATGQQNGNGKIANGQQNGDAQQNGSVVAKAKTSRTNGANGKVKLARNGRRIDQFHARLVQSKDLAFRADDDGDVRDRLVAMVRDPYWLHACWELRRQTIERARAALRQYWHASKPVLRLLEVAREGATSNVRKVVRDIEIHGGVNNWYIDVQQPPKSFQMEIGYLAPGGKFLSLARSNIVTTPPVDSAKSTEGVWTGSSDDFDRIYALSGGYSEAGDQSELRDMFEQRLRRPMGPSIASRFGHAVQGFHNGRDFAFQVDAELVVFGVTDPNAQVTLKGEPVHLQPDGTFTMRFPLADRRQVLPVVASSNDGTEQRTIVLAVERNTKVMEPVSREPDSP